MTAVTMRRRAVYFNTWHGSIHTMDPWMPMDASSASREKSGCQVPLLRSRLGPSSPSLSFFFFSFLPRSCLFRASGLPAPCITYLHYLLPVQTWSGNTGVPAGRGGPIAFPNWF